MDVRSLLQIRLANLQISRQKFSEPEKLMEYMVAVQAQDRKMAEWALGFRCAKVDSGRINLVLNARKILRTHVLRPTWHFVRSQDLDWLLELSAGRVMNSLRSRHRQLEISPKLLEKSSKLIKKTLEENGQMSREELIPVFQKAKINTTENRLAHLLLWAELEGLIASGSGTGHTYALLPNRKKPGNTREELLEKLAANYFLSRGPATVSDFTWWSGLSPGEARQAHEMVSGKFEKWLSRGTTYLFREPAKKDISPLDGSVYLLPAYDEYLISYKDRSAIITNGKFSRAISVNGIFWPVVVVNGKVEGIWKRSIVKGMMQIKAEMFSKTSNAQRKKITDVARKFADFVGKDLEVRIVVL